MRLPFIVLTPACVVLGIATAFGAGARPVWWEVALVVVGAILAHLAVNVFNEYQDFRSGLDAKTKRTPFSGGSGTLQEHPELAGRTLALAIVCTVLTAGIGVYFVIAGSLLLLVVGAAGIIVVAMYTPWIVRRPLACLIAPGLGFGTCMVIGAHVALGATVTLAPVIVSFVPFFLVSNLLLLNQFPDIDPDRAVGRNNILTAFGTRFGTAVYGLFLVLSYVAIGAGVAGGLFPALGLIGLATIPLAALAFRGAILNRDDPEKLVPSLGLNVIIVLLTPALTAVGMLVG